MNNYEDKVCKSVDVKRIGVTNDKKVKFDEHVSKICSKAIRKLNALARMSKFLTFRKKRNVCKIFIESHFKYCLLI